MTPATTSHVMPDSIRHPAFLGTALKGSETPDQVRGDGMCDVVQKLLAINFIGTME
jgi:hypothetical protein